MKRNTLPVLAALLALAGCDSRPDVNGQPTENSKAAYTVRTVDTQYGVACYRYGSSSNNLSCVKVN